MNYRITIIITAWKEEKTIGKAIESLINPEKGNLLEDMQILVVCPDEKTWQVASETAEKFKFSNIQRLKDPKNGKPYALNLALKEVKSDIIALTDGDVYIGENSLPKMLKHFKDKKVGGVTGRPVSIDSRNTFMGYIGHLLADAAHHKRLTTMTSNPSGHSMKIVSKEPGFFVLSGYILAMRNIDLSIPNDCLIEDAYISYSLHNKDYSLAYEPDAVAYVKYADNLVDWFKQKLRSVGGYEQIDKYDIYTKDKKIRNLTKELEYFWFPIKYASSLKEYFWSILLYPLRIILWIRIFWQRKVVKKSFKETWVRVESTK